MSVERPAAIERITDNQKKEFANIVVDTAVTEFLRQIAALLNHSPDKDTLKDLSGQAADGYVPNLDDFKFHISDRSNYPYLVPTIISTLDSYQYDPTNENAQTCAQTLIGSRIRNTYDEFNKRISKSIHHPQKTLDIDTHFESVLFIIRAFRNNLWSNILPEFLEKNNFLDPKEKEKIIYRFRNGTKFIESHIMQTNNPMDSRLNQLRAKVIQMDNRYLPYFNDDIPL